METLRQLLEQSRHLTGEHVAEFVEELKSVPFDDSKPVGALQGPAGSLQRSIAIQKLDGVLDASALYTEWAHTKEREIAQRVKERYLATTYEVRYWKGRQFGKPERMPKDELDKAWKQGLLLMSEKGRIQGHNFDSDFGPTLTLKKRVRELTEQLLTNVDYLTTEQLEALRQGLVDLELAEREGEFRHGLGNRLAFLQASGNGKAEFHELL